MSKKIVAIGGGENGRISSDGTRKPYETAEIDKEIIRLTGKEHPNFLLLAHSQIPFGYEKEKRYYETMERVYGDIYGCECRWLPIDELKTDKEKTINDVEWADIIYEGGGDTYDMINLWIETGFDKILKKTWEDGKVMCGISAGSICWFTNGNTLDPRFINDECNKINGLGFIDAYLSPHCNYDGKRESEIRSLKYLKQVGISLSNCCALEIVDDKYRIIKSKSSNPEFEPYALKTFWCNDEPYEEVIDDSTEYKLLSDLLTKKKRK